MRKHFYLITDHPTNDDHEGRIQITDKQLQNSNKNVETVSHILDKENGEFLEKLVVSMGYVDFDDEDDYEENIGDAVDRKLAEIDEQHLVNAGLDPDDVFDRGDEQEATA